MTKEIGDQELIDSWAYNGALQAPDGSKIDVGWLSGERPAFQYMNWLQNLFCQKINYILRTGVPGHSTATTYEEDDIVHHNGVLYRAIAQNTNSVPPSADWALLGAKNKIDATAPPTVDNDSTEGYSVNSQWIDTSNGEAYLCFDASVGAAIWVKTTLSIDELGSAAFADASDFATAAQGAAAANTITSIVTVEYTTSGSYTPDADVVGYLAEWTGAGGGGGGYSSGSGTDGGDTTFDGIVAKGGKGGAPGYTYYTGAGDGGYGGSGTAESVRGNPGTCASTGTGGTGGASPLFGGAGWPGSDTNGTGRRDGENGGGGAGAATQSNAYPGGKGGGSGEVRRKWYWGDSSTKTFTIGARGVKASGSIATDGGLGKVRITEFRKD